MIIKIYLKNKIQFSFLFIKPLLWGVPGPFGSPLWVRHWCPLHLGSLFEELRQQLLLLHKVISKELSNWTRVIDLLRNVENRSLACCDTIYQTPCKLLVAMMREFLQWLTFINFSSGTPLSSYSRTRAVHARLKLSAEEFAVGTSV